MQTQAARSIAGGDYAEGTRMLTTQRTSRIPHEPERRGEMGQRGSTQTDVGGGNGQAGSTEDFLSEMIDRLTKEERDALKKLLLEYGEREALHDWARRCFSSAAKIIVTVSALVIAIGGVSAGISWIIGHIK